MVSDRILHSLPLGVALAALVACRADDAARSPAPMESEQRLAATAAPRDAALPVADDAGSPLQYLLAKYDHDGDGRITTDEYDRDGGPFMRLDRNGDGVIDAGDFAAGGAGGDERMRSMRAQRLFATYFQSDGEPESLTIVEFEIAFERFDVAHYVDGMITRDEFAAVADDQRVALPGDDSGMVRAVLHGVDPWDALVVVIDDNGDGRIAFAEAAAFFSAHEDGDDAWIVRAPSSGRPADASMSGPAEGTPAPDFTLETLHGGALTTLSSFRDAKPVALVFGSYT